jgi:4-carboxymuconolactone decarboxylase
MTVAGAFAIVQAPSIEQLRQTVSRLRGNRIETPNDWDKLTPQQKKYVESILSGPRGDITGPLGVMMVSPELGDLSQKAIAYSRFAGREGFSSVPPKLNELAILVVAKHWSAEYVWNAHHTAAVRLGIPAEVVEAIRTGQRPVAMEKDVETVYNFVTDFIGKR